MNKINELLREIPQVEKLMQDADIASLIPETGRGIAAGIIREAVEDNNSVLNINEFKIVLKQVMNIMVNILTEQE